MARLELITTALTDVKLFQPQVFEDDRGFFMETYKLSAFGQSGFTPAFVQDNQSLSREAGTVRGLHYQHSPFAQDKLVRCIRGRIWDVAVDIRRSSPTFRKWVGAELSADNRLQLFVPAGFAHGFLTLEPDTEVVYKVSAEYSAAHDAGIRWDDPELGIDWPLLTSQPVLSARDNSLPTLGEAILFD